MQFLVHTREGGSNYFSSSSESVFRPCSLSGGKGEFEDKVTVGIGGADGHLIFSSKGPVFVCGNVQELFVNVMDSSEARVPGIRVDTLGNLVVDTGVPGMVEICIT